MSQAPAPATEKNIIDGAAGATDKSDAGYGSTTQIKLGLHYKYNCKQHVGQQIIS